MLKSNYRFFDVKRTVPQENINYLIDANVWIMVLSPPENLDAYELSYIKFFDKLINLASTAKNPPKIVVPDLIISEVFNAFLRNCMDAYNGIENTRLDFKKYRSTDDCYDNLKILQDDFGAFDSFILEPEKCFNCISMLETIPANTDFNDYCYFEYAVSHGYKILTNDGDFLYQGVDIITNNGRLLRSTDV